MINILLQDDFYLNLVDWSGQNILSVGLGTCVYLWSACTSQVLQILLVEMLVTNVVIFFFKYDPCSIRL